MTRTVRSVIVAGILILLLASTAHAQMEVYQVDRCVSVIGQWAWKCKRSGDGKTVVCAWWDGQSPGVATGCQAV